MPKKVRILVDSHGYKCNDVVLLPDDVAKALAADGSADADKAAVAYALSLGDGKVIDATVPATDHLAEEIAALEAQIKVTTDSDKAAELQATLDDKRAELAKR